MKELKPCPFCGVTPFVGVCLPDGSNTERTYVRCKNSKCLVRPRASAVMPIGAGKDRASEIWNKRKS